MVVHLFLNNNKALDFLPINSIKNGGITVGIIAAAPHQRHQPVEAEIGFVRQYLNAGNRIDRLTGQLGNLTGNTDFIGERETAEVEAVAAVRGGYRLF